MYSLSWGYFVSKVTNIYMGITVFRKFYKQILLN